MRDLQRCPAYARELHDKQARFARPDPDDNAPVLTYPFGNRLRVDDSRNHH